MKSLYLYRASVSRIVDGDTVDLTVDVGFRTFVHVRVRLVDINAPEMNTPQGRAAKVFLSQILPLGLRCEIETFKDPTDKYGRWIAEIYLPDAAKVTDRLVEAGHAERHHY